MMTGKIIAVLVALCFVFAVILVFACVKICSIEEKKLREWMDNQKLTDDEFDIPEWAYSEVRLENEAAEQVRKQEDCNR